jgi:hypothetical protein
MCCDDRDILAEYTIPSEYHSEVSNLIHDAIELSRFTNNMPYMHCAIELYMRFLAANRPETPPAITDIQLAE